MPCTVKKTFQIAAKARCRLIAQVKSNQPGLLARIERLCRDDAPATRHESLDDKARSRHETRRTEVFAVGQALKGSDWHGLIASVIRVRRDPSQTEGLKYDPDNHLLMYAMGPNLAGVIGTAAAAGMFIAMFK